MKLMYIAELSCQIGAAERQKFEEEWLEHDLYSDVAARRIRFEFEGNRIKVIKRAPADWDEQNLKQSCAMALHRALGDKVEVRWLD